MSRFCSVITCTTPSVVRPALVGRRDGGTLVLHRDATKGIVLALRVTGPVVRHEDACQRRVAVELDAEHVPGLTLMPVVGRVYLDDGGDVAVIVGAGDLESDLPATVGDRPQVIDRMQLATGLMRVVDTRDAGAHLEAQRGVVTQRPGDTHQMLPGDEEGHLTSVDHDPGNGLLVGRAPADEGTLQTPRDFVEVPAVRAGGRSREEHGSHQTAVPAGVSAVRDTEHALSRADDHGLGIRPRGGRKVLPLSSLAHASRPFISCVGVAASAAASAAWAASTRLTPRGVFWICSWRVMIALSNISGRGGQPGR